MPASCLLAVCSWMLFLTQMWCVCLLVLSFPRLAFTKGSLREKHVVTSMNPKRNEALTRGVFGKKWSQNPIDLQTPQRDSPEMPKTRKNTEPGRS